MDPLGDAVGDASLGEVLEDVSGGGTLLSVQPGGNHGDTLIYRGFDALVADLAVDRVPFAAGENRYDGPPLPTLDARQTFRFVRQHALHLGHRLRTDPAAVYIHGGGNFNDVWKGGINCLLTVARYFDCPVVVGPQSCRFESIDPARVFDRVDNDLYFFCREQYSLEIMREATAGRENVSLGLDHDTALALAPADLPLGETVGEAAVGETAGETAAEYALVAMRADRESASPILGEDIAAPIRVSDASVAASSFTEFVETVARARVVYTDRLHVAIPATILDIPVTWYEIGYHKARGVYEHSLADRETVTFVPREQWA